MEKLFKEVGKIVQQLKITQNESLKRGERFNVFSALRVDHYETKHSAFIAELLNTEGSHGQGTTFLSSFLKVCCFKDFEFSLQGVKVYTEFVIKGGRLDILVTNNNKQGLIIENKIYSPDGDKQLITYNEDASERFPNGYKILYLTPDGDKASEQSAKGVDYQTLSYRTDIINWLEECVLLSAHLPLIRETIIQYINHIKQLTNQDMDRINKEKLLATMAENAEQVKAIYSVNWLEYLEYVFGKHVRPKLEKLDGLTYKETDLFAERGERGFYFLRKEWTRSAIWIYTSHTSHLQPDLFRIGISNYYGDPLEVDIQKLDCLEERPDKYWPYGWESLGKYSNWYPQNDTIIDMIDDANGCNEFVEYVKAKVKEILDEIDKKGIQMP